MEGVVGAGVGLWWLEAPAASNRCKGKGAGKGNDDAPRGVRIGEQVGTPPDSHDDVAGGDGPCSSASEPRVGRSTGVGAVESLDGSSQDESEVSGFPFCLLC